MYWYKAHVSAGSDQKLLFIAKETRQMYATILGVWHLILIFGCEHDGSLKEVNYKILCMMSGIEFSIFEEIISLMKELKMIDNEKIINWNERQNISDSGAERTRRYREKLKKNNNLTCDSQDECDASSHRDVTQCHACDAVTSRDGIDKSRVDKNKIDKRREDNNNISVTVKKMTSNKINDNEKYTPAFEEFWALYPKRAGGDSKPAAFRNWKARLKEGVAPHDLLGAAERYSNYCFNMDRLNTEYVRKAANFLGRDKHYEESWEIKKDIKPKKKSIGEMIAFGDKVTERCRELGI